MGSGRDRAARPQAGNPVSNLQSYTESWKDKTLKSNNSWSLSLSFVGFSALYVHGFKLLAAAVGD